MQEAVRIAIRGYLDEGARTSIAGAAAAVLEAHGTALPRPGVDRHRVPHGEGPEAPAGTTDV